MGKMDRTPANRFGIFLNSPLLMIDLNLYLNTIKVIYPENIKTYGRRRW